MSNIKLKNHYWNAQSVFDPTQGKTQEALNAQSAELIASSTVASTGTTGATAATFTANAAGPMEKLLVNIEMTQSGSGDPSPSNVMPISQWAEVNIVISPTQQAVDGETITASIFDPKTRTYHYGTLDLLKGLLKVSKCGKKIKDISWTYNSKYDRFQSSNVAPSVKPAASQYSILDGLLCETYKVYAPSGTYALQNNGIAVTNNGTILIKDTRYTTVSDFTAAMGEYLIVYPPKYPFDYQIEPQSITTLLGVNNIWSDTGTVTVTYGAYIQSANEHAADLAMSRAGRGYITPEQFGAVGDGETDDSAALQNCLENGGAIMLSREYYIGDAQLVADKQIELVCTADSKIIADPFEFSKGGLPSAVLTLTAEKSRVYGMRVFSRIVFDSQGSANNEYPTYIEVNRSETASGAGSNRYALFVEAPRCVIRDLYGEYCSLIRLGDNNHEGCVIDGLYGNYIEIGIYAAKAKNVIVNNVRINVSKYVLSDYYHVFYFCNPENCAFSNVVVGASGEVNKDGSPYINSDIFHFNFSYKDDPPNLGGDVVVTNATIIDGCFKRFTQVNDNVRAYFSNCTGKFTDTICLIGDSSGAAEGEPSATFTGCTFTITNGNSNHYGFRSTANNGRFWLRDCKIIDLSTDGYLISGGVVADGCTFEVEKWKINVSSASTSPKFVKFHNCVINADALAIDEGHPDNDGGGISPNNSAFTSEYHNCKFVFPALTSPPALISRNNLSTVLVIGGSVENCSSIYSNQGSNANVIVINLPYRNGSTWTVFNRLSGGT